MVRTFLKKLRFVSVCLFLSYVALAQRTKIFTITAVNLTILIGSLAQATQSGLGTSFSIDYSIKSMFALMWPVGQPYQ